MEKSEDYLNNLVQVYNKWLLPIKIYFWEYFNVYRLEGEINHVELDGVEQDVESFEEQQIDRYWIKKYFFVEVPVNMIKKLEIEVQLNVISSMLDFMKKSSTSDLLPK
jgi:hypothetical protein